MSSVRQVKKTNGELKRQRFLNALEHVTVHDHLCFFYETKNEQFDAIIPFMRIGLEQGDKCIYVADENAAQDVLAAMQEQGIDVKRQTKKGALAVITKRDSYLRKGYFDPDEMIQFLKDETTKAKKEGYRALRVTGEMTWMLGGDPGSERLLEYEAKLNAFFATNESLAVCQYNRKRFGPDVLIGVIQTHPLVVVGSVVCKNFYFVPAGDFLQSKGKKTEVDRMLQHLVNREELEEEYELSSSYARGLLEASLDPLVTISPTGKITDVNHATELATGLSRDRLIGTDFSNYFTEPEKARKGYKEVFKNGFVRDYPLVIRGVDGTLMDVSYNASVYKDNDGNVQGVFAAARDLTALHHVEAKIRESEEKFSMAFHASPNLMAITDMKGTLLDVNEAFTKMLGYSRAEVVGKTTADLKIWGNSADRKTFISKLEATGQISNFETTLRKKDGTEVPVVDSARTVTLQGKKCVLSIIDDITDRKQIEAALRQNSNYVRGLIEASIDPLVTISPEGKITDVNKATELATGIPRKKLIGTDFTAYFTEPEQAKKGYKTVFREGEVRNFPLALRHVSGKITDVLYNATVFKDENGNVQGVFAAARDVTELKRLELEREQFFKFFNISPDIMVIADPNGAFKRCNPATTTILGYSEKELLAKPFVDFITPEDKKRTSEEMALQIARGSTLNFENRYLCKDGSVRWLSWRAIYDKTDNTTYATARDITESKLVNERIRESEERLNEAQHVANMGSWNWDAVKDVIFWSDEYHRIVGLPLGATPPNYENHLKMYSEESAKRLGEAVQRATKDGTPYELELNLIHPPGTNKWVLARGEAIKDAKGKVVALRGTILDITERRTLEQEVRRRNRALRVMSEGNRILVHAQTEQEMFDRMCRNFVEEGGYRMAWIGIAEHDERKSVRVAASAGFDEGYLHQVDVVWSTGPRGQGPTGSAVRMRKTVVASSLEKQPNFEPWRKSALEHGYASSVALPLYFKNEVYGAVTIYSAEPDAFKNDELRLLEELAGDISYGISVLRLREESQEAASLLKREAEEVSDLYHNAPCGYHSLDKNGVYVRVNDTELKWFGYSRDEVIGKKKFTDLVTQEGVEQFRRVFPKFKKEGKMSDLEYEMVRKDGTTFPISISASAIYDAAGEFQMSRGMMFDISERKKAEGRIKESNQLKNEFIKIVSHQLRTPLSVIRWNLDAILNRKRGLVPPAQEEALRSSYIANVEVITRIGDLVTALDIEENRVFLEKDRVDLSELFRSTCEEKLRECDPKRITYEVQEPASPLPFAEIDAAKIRDVIKRLIDNAIIYTPEGGRITIKYERTNAHVRFEIIDTGIGIPTSEQSRVFERFHRGWNAAQMKQDASGLSLFISRHYIEEHQGEIGFVSKEKQGSTFWFEIPVGRA